MHSYSIAKWDNIEWKNYFCKLVMVLALNWGLTYNLQLLDYVFTKNAPKLPFVLQSQN